VPVFKPSVALTLQCRIINNAAAAVTVVPCACVCATDLNDPDNGCDYAERITGVAFPVRLQLTAVITSNAFLYVHLPA
jgi:hypothetical protein